MLDSSTPPCPASNPSRPRHCQPRPTPQHGAVQPRHRPLRSPPRPPHPFRRTRRPTTASSARYWARCARPCAHGTSVSAMDWGVRGVCWMREPRWSGCRAHARCTKADGSVCSNILAVEDGPTRPSITPHWEAYQEHVADLQRTFDQLVRPVNPHAPHSAHPPVAHRTEQAPTETALARRHGRSDLVRSAPAKGRRFQPRQSAVERDRHMDARAVR